MCPACITHPLTLSRLIGWLDQFRAARFFALRDAYTAQVIDNPSYIVSIDIGNGAKTVLDYVGRMEGMPESVNRLQQAIDEAAGTRRWIEGTRAVLPLLIRENASYTGLLGLELMDAAAGSGDIAMLEELVALRAPLSAPLSAPDEAQRAPRPAFTAISEQQDDAFDWLLANGALRDPARWQDALWRTVENGNHHAYRALRSERHAHPITPDLATRILGSAALNADLVVLEEMLALGGDPNGPRPLPIASDPPLFDAANGVASQGEKRSDAGSPRGRAPLAGGGRANPTLPRRLLRQPALACEGCRNRADAGRCRGRPEPSGQC